MQLLGALLATSITAIQTLQTKAYTWSLQCPSYFFVWAFSLCCQLGRKSVTGKPQVSFSSGMKEMLFLHPTPPQGWRVGLRFWRCEEAMQEPRPPKGRHQDRSPCPGCPRQAMVHLTCSVPSTPALQSKQKIRNLRPWLSVF